MRKSSEAVLVFSKELNRFSYGVDHPLRIERLQLTMDLISAYGLLKRSKAPWVEAGPAENSDLLLIHTGEYLDVLRQADTGRTPAKAWKHGLGSGDNPVFPGMYRWSTLVTGATLESIRQILAGNARIAFSISGGLHHAMPDRASGFCYINDPAVGIARMVRNGMRVAYVDIDVHHGDGVEAAFYDTDRVLTISLHQTGHTLFPGTGFPQDIGRGPGRGYAVNVPLAPGTGDNLYHWVFMEIVPPLINAFEPDVLVTQLGADTLAADPLAGLSLTVEGYLKLIQEMKSWGKKWVALGGGGYNVMNVAKAWSRAWGLMKGTEVPASLPGSFVKDHPEAAGDGFKLPGQSHETDPGVAYSAKKLAEGAVKQIKNSVFPVVGV